MVPAPLTLELGDEGDPYLPIEPISELTQYTITTAPTLAGSKKARTL